MIATDEINGPLLYRSQGFSFETGTVHVFPTYDIFSLNFQVTNMQDCKPPHGAHAVTSTVNMAELQTANATWDVQLHPVLSVADFGGTAYTRSNFLSRKNFQCFTPQN